MRNWKKAFREVKPGEAGWTYIETIIVIAIVLILTSTVGIMTSRSIENAKKVTARSQIETYAMALESYYLDCGSYPSEEQGLEALYAKPSIDPIPESWNGRYITKAVSPDPWGNPYRYTSPEQDLPFGILSYGSDGREGGEGDAEDIVSWEN